MATKLENPEEKCMPASKAGRFEGRGAKLDRAVLTDGAEFSATRTFVRPGSATINKPSSQQAGVPPQWFPVNLLPSNIVSTPTQERQEPCKAMTQVQPSTKSFDLLILSTRSLLKEMFSHF
jgi:hypothetical protein